MRSSRDDLVSAFQRTAQCGTAAGDLCPTCRRANRLRSTNVRPRVDQLGGDFNASGAGPRRMNSLTPTFKSTPADATAQA